MFSLCEGGGAKLFGLIFFGFPSCTVIWAGNYRGLQNNLGVGFICPFIFFSFENTSNRSGVMGQILGTRALAQVHADVVYYRADNILGLKEALRYQMYIIGFNADYRSRLLSLLA